MLKLKIVSKFYNDLSIGYLEDKPVFVDDRGYLYVQPEGVQIQLDVLSGRWCATVKDSKWELIHSSHFPQGQFDFVNPCENGPDYDPDDYKIIRNDKDDTSRSIMYLE